MNGIKEFDAFRHQAPFCVEKEMSSHDHTYDPAVIFLQGGGKRNISYRFQAEGSLVIRMAFMV